MTAMAIMSNVLRVLSDFGDAAGWLIAALVLFLYGRRILAENEEAHGALDRKIDTVAQENRQAHAAITENLQENRRRIDTVAETLNGRIDTVAQTLNGKIDAVARDVGAIARDVSFLAGRQAERDGAGESAR